MTESAESGTRRDTPEDVSRRKQERHTESELESMGWKARQNIVVHYEQGTKKSQSWAYKKLRVAIARALKSISSSERKNYIKKTRLGFRVYYSPEVVEKTIEELNRISPTK